MQKDLAAAIVGRLISLVPQWYVASYGPFTHRLSLGDYSIVFCSQRQLTPRLRWLFETISSTVDSKVDTPVAVVPLFADLLQEYYAIRWLKQYAKGVNWTRLVRFLHSVSKRTSENNPISLNLVCSDGEGRARIDDANMQRLVDQMGASPFTLLRVNGSLEYIGYEEISWDDVRESDSYKFHPEFLHPFHCVLKDGEFSVHLTNRGDIVIMDSKGLLASKRKGGWKLYDVSTVKNAMGDCLGDYSAGANLFEVLFNLSFRRHGALLVYDPNGAVLKKIVNKDSILNHETSGNSGQAMIADAVSGISIAGGVNSLDRKRLLAEIASVDGAIVFDGNSILALGAVIQSARDIPSRGGARTTAALSAYHWGGRPVKVSSDGEITFYFESSDGQSKCDAVIEFL